MGEAQHSENAKSSAKPDMDLAGAPRPRAAIAVALPDWRMKLERQIGLTRAMLGFERLWPVLWWPLGVVLAFLTFSWLGAWVWLLPHWRMLGVGLFALALLASFWPLTSWRWPGRHEAIDRLDGTALNAHRPAAALDDALALGEKDQVAQSLWRLHQLRQQEALQQLSVQPPRPLMAARDLRALRFVPVLGAVAALFVAGPEMLGRLGSAFQWFAPPVPPPQARLDAWIDPPAYTRLPPILIDLATLRKAGAPAALPLRAPQNSSLIVRIAGPEAALATTKVETQGGLQSEALGEPPAKQDGYGTETGASQPQASPAALPAALPAASLAASLAASPANPNASTARESRYRLTGDASLAILLGTQGRVDLKITSIPDRAPEIDYVEAPKANERGGLGVVYRARDDYGLASVEAQFERQAAGTARPLIEPPRMALALPSSPVGEEDTKATLELAEHPWAGARVLMKLVARDEAGQEGASPAREVLLPQRTFTNALAKALVEERRRLILDIGARRHVQVALDALLIAPDVFMPEKGNYLGLKMIASQLRRARANPQLVEVTEQLWALALHLEDGGLSDAERDLRAAQERLQQALERGANEEEIGKLTDEMRRAMDRFMRDFAQRMEKEQRGQDMSKLPENFRTVTPRDLRSLLDRIEELAKRGETAEAQRLLEELRNMMQNLQAARPGQRDPAGQQRNEAMNELDKMMRDQQALRDDTFREGEERRNGRQARPPRRPSDPQAKRPGERQQPGQRGQQPGDEQEGDDGEDEQGADGQPGRQKAEQGQSLQERQQALRDRLRQLQQQMQGLGMPGEDGLDEADGAMGEAEQALGGGEGENPGEGQGQQQGKGQGKGQGKDQGKAQGKPGGQQNGQQNGQPGSQPGGKGGGESRAADAQGRALDALRRGSQNLAQKMQQPGEGEGEGDGTENAQGDPNSPTGRARADSRGRDGERDDPLGRPQRQRDWAQGNVKVPGADESATQRARRVLEELRRRLGQSSRPQDELDYLERLLRRN